MDYCLAIKRSEVLTHAITWINLENIMVNERSQTQMTTYYNLCDFVYMKCPESANL